MSSLSPQQKMGGKHRNPGYDEKEKNEYWAVSENIYSVQYAGWNTVLIAVLQAARESGDSRISGVCSGDYDWWPSVGYWQDTQEGAEAQPALSRCSGTGKHRPLCLETRDTGVVLRCVTWSYDTLLWEVRISSIPSLVLSMLYEESWHLTKYWWNLSPFLQVNSKGYKVYGAGSSLYGGTITINARKVMSGAWLWSKGGIMSRRACV